MIKGHGFENHSIKHTCSEILAVYLNFSLRFSFTISSWTIPLFTEMCFFSHFCCLLYFCLNPRWGKYGEAE